MIGDIIAHSDKDVMDMLIRGNFRDRIRKTYACIFLRSFLSVYKGNIPIRIFCSSEIYIEEIRQSRSLRQVYFSVSVIIRNDGDIELCPSHLSDLQARVKEFLAVISETDYQYIELFFILADMPVQRMLIERIQDRKGRILLCSGVKRSLNFGQDPFFSSPALLCDFRRKRVEECLAEIGDQRFTILISLFPFAEAFLQNADEKISQTGM